MANRTQNNQSIHDRVIEIAASRLDPVNYDIYKNQGQQKNAGVGDNYPDIILTKKNKLTLEYIIEVETEDSVNITEATNQWKKYSKEIKASFFILVPLKTKNLAINLCKKIGITARFGTYELDKFGNIIKISYE